MANQWTASAPCTAEELYGLYHEKGLSQQEIGDLFGLGRTAVSRHMKRAGIGSRQAVARNQSGSRNNNWRGGRVMRARKAGRPNIKSCGYWYVWMPGHPNATKAGYVAEHMAIAAPAGLPPGRVVHHVNLNKHDNRPGNLIVLTVKMHADLHAQLSALAGSMVESGMIRFDGSRYSLTLQGGDSMCR